MKFVEIKDLDQHELYKVCQITIDGIPSMYFVKDRCGLYHKDILKEVLTLNGLPHTVVKALGDEGLVYRGNGFVVNGMGGARLLRTNCVMLFGNSIGFDMCISNAHVEKFQKINPEWRFMTPKLQKESLAS